MNEINEEIKLTLDLMQGDIDDGAHNELQYHLNSLLEIKRERLATETGLQAELERERERRFEGNRIASAEHREELERLVVSLEEIAGLELLTTDGASECWRKFCEAQRIAESAIAQYREEPVTHEARPLTTEELTAGDWWCDDVSEDCANALKSKRLRVFNSSGWGNGVWVGCVMDSCGNVKRKGLFFDFAGKKQIHRIGDEFYWSDK